MTFGSKTKSGPIHGISISNFYKQMYNIYGTPNDCTIHVSNLYNSTRMCWCNYISRECVCVIYIYMCVCVCMCERQITVISSYTACTKYVVFINLHIFLFIWFLFTYIFEDCRKSGYFFRHPLPRDCCYFFGHPVSLFSVIIRTKIVEFQIHVLLQVLAVC